MFHVLNSQPVDVKNKFLEGMPYQTNFPGPFQGPPQGPIMNVQQSAVHRESNPKGPNNMVEPLSRQSRLYPSFNGGEPNCSGYGAEIQLSPPLEYKLDLSNASGEGILAGPSVDRFKDVLYGGDQINWNVETFKDPDLTDPQSQTGFGDIIPKFITNGGVKCSSGNNPLLDIKNRPTEQFSHNNMVPYYGPKLTQNMANTGVPQAGDNNTCDGFSDGYADVTPNRGKLEIFTGLDEMYMHKRETSPFFSPAEQQTGWVYGAPAFRPDMERFKTNIWMRANESPVEKIQVGPGIGLDYTVPAQGGLQQFARVLPNNVSDYKANQLENRVNGGKWSVDHPTSQYIHGVTKTKPDVTITQARRPTMPTQFYTQAPDGGSSGITNYFTDANKGKQSREDTGQSGGFGQFDLKEYIYDGSGKLTKKDNVETFVDTNGMPCVNYSSAPIGMTMGSHVPQQSQELQSYNNIRETFKRGDMGCLDNPQGTDQWGIIMGPAQGVVPSQENRSGKYINYTDRGDINPYVINATGSTQWSPNSYQQPAKTTKKETTEYAFAGNPTGSNTKAYINSWDDQQKVTRKETTDYAYAGNAQMQSVASYTNKWDSDPMKVTRKETTDYAFAGNAARGGMAQSNRFMWDGSVSFPVK